jgi:hypothetical protein
MTMAKAAQAGTRCTHCSSGTHLTEHHHLPLVRVRAEVALEPILVSALLAAHLAVPSQLLQALRLDAVGYLHETVHGRREVSWPNDNFGHGAVGGEESDEAGGKGGGAACRRRTQHTAFGDRKSFLPMVCHAAGGSICRVLSCAQLGAMRL